MRSVQGTARRTSDDTYNLNGYDLIWDGMPAPPPPPTCDRDPLGYCAVETSVDNWVAPCSGGGGYALERDHYLIYTPSGTAQYTHETSYQDDGAGNCSTWWTWTPGDPQYDFNDPYLI
jgi:hypothetical protein